MDGFETVIWLTENHPEIKVLALSVEDNEQIILKMIREGAKGYFLKDIHPDELEEALLVVIDKGYYYSERVTSSMVNALHPRITKPSLSKKRMSSPYFSSHVRR